MKKRSGFVANSSSSSYICDICHCGGEIDDDDFKESGYFQCENKHVFCECHVGKDFPLRLTRERAIEILKERLKQNPYNKNDIEEVLKYIPTVSDEDWDDYSYNIVEECVTYEWRLHISSKDCPICNLSAITDDMKVKYLLQMTGMTEKNLEKLIKDSFESLKEFEKYLK